MCDLFSLLRGQIPADRLGLAGRVLRVAAASYPPYVFYDEVTGDFSGFTIDVLNFICDKHGMDMRVELFTNGGSTDLIKAVGRGEYDVGAKSLILSAPRLGLAQFTRRISEFQIAIAIRFADSRRVDYNLFGFFAPFETGIWAALAASLLLYLALLWLYRSKLPGSQPDSQKPPKRQNFKARVSLGASSALAMVSHLVDSSGRKSEKWLAEPGFRVAFFTFRLLMLVWTWTPHSVLPCVWICPTAIAQNLCARCWLPSTQRHWLQT